MDDRVHVCYCANRKMLEPLCVSAFSVAASVAERDITIWVFHSDFYSADVGKLLNILDPFPNAALEVESINVDAFDEVRGLHGDVMPFTKLILPRLMDGKTERIVFLDADTVVVGGLDDLYQRNLEGHILGAVSYETLGCAQESDFFRAGGLDLEKNSFNSGVMLIDVERWNAADKSGQLINQVKQVDPQEAESDQPFLNVAFYDNFLPLRIRFNKRAGPDSKLKKKHTTDGILHFVGIPKPWDIGSRWLNKNYHLYEKHRKRAGVSKRSPREIIRDDGWRRVAKGLLSGLRALVG